LMDAFSFLFYYIFYLWFILEENRKQIAAEDHEKKRFDPQELPKVRNGEELLKSSLQWSRIETTPEKYERIFYLRISVPLVAQKNIVLFKH
jgi:hypothetical protein